MTSVERLRATLNHTNPDQLCVDFGATNVTGIAAVAVSKLRQALLKDDTPVKVTEPYQMLGAIEDDLLEAIRVDVLGVLGPKTMFGFENTDWKPFTMFDGTEVLVPGDFNVTKDENGGWLIYPEGDTSVPPSGHMPKDGFYFDATDRQGPIDESTLNIQDNLEEFLPLDEHTVSHLVNEAEKAAARGMGAVLSCPGTAFGDIALVPAMWRKHVKGIRGVEEWYMSTLARPEYVYAVFEKQCEIALQNLALLVEALGDKVQVAFTTGTDFGTQQGCFIAPDTYRNLYMPFHKQVNDFIHKHTNWKTFIHSCGSIIDLIPDFIDAGFDILNPVQCSAAGMDARKLKKDFGNAITFWGGGVDTQKTMAFGTPEEVYDEVRQRIEIFSEDGGFVFNAIHNLQANTPVENMLAMFQAVSDCRSA